MKGLVFLALRNAIKRSGRNCHALVDGMAVRFGARTVFEPDAQVYASIRHYLIVDPDERLVLHYERRDDDVVITHILREGVASLDPPGLELALSELYEA
jgi:hypothetical protein